MFMAEIVISFRKWKYILTYPFKNETALPLLPLTKLLSLLYILQVANLLVLSSKSVKGI